MAEFKTIIKAVGFKREKDINDFDAEIMEYMNQGWEVVSATTTGNALIAFVQRK